LTVSATLQCGTTIIGNLLDGGRGNDGTWSSHAWITTDNPPFCWGSDPNANTDDISAWSMVRGQSGSEYAQTGYIRKETWTDGFEHFFMAYRDTHMTEQFQSFGISYVGENHKYEQYFNQPRGDIQLWEDSNLLAVTPFNPYGDWTGPWNSEWSGETKDGGDAMPGTLPYPNNTVNFTYVSYEPSIGGSWQQEFSYNLLNSEPQYYYYASENNYPSEAAFSIWTQGM